MTPPVSLSPRAERNQQGCKLTLPPFGCQPPSVMALVLAWHAGGAAWDWVGGLLVGEWGYLQPQRLQMTLPPPGATKDKLFLGPGAGLRQTFTAVGGLPTTVGSQPAAVDGQPTAIGPSPRGPSSVADGRRGTLSVSTRPRTSPLGLRLCLGVHRVHGAQHDFDGAQRLPQRLQRVRRQPPDDFGHTGAAPGPPQAGGHEPDELSVQSDGDLHRVPVPCQRAPAPAAASPAHGPVPAGGPGAAPHPTPARGAPAVHDG